MNPSYLRPGNCPAECHLHLSSVIPTSSQETCQIWLSLNCMWTTSPCAPLLVFLTGRQALGQRYIFFYFTNVILAIFLSHQRWLEVLTMYPVDGTLPLSCLPVNGPQWQINSLGMLSHFSLTFKYLSSEDKWDPVQEFRQRSLVVTHTLCKIIPKGITICLSIPWPFTV